ncbi:MAG: efflux RND transporter periplasmic adaptor subunit [Caldilineaceae bacterium]|nr:efflux RND transporter periplasmic adaptor subunit [Caldilineaceae bacterium]
MKRVGVIALVIALGLAGWWAYQTYWVRPAAQEAERAAERAAEEAADIENVIWASGTLKPTVWAGLSTAVSGVVRQIYVAEGDWVEAGDLLLDLENQVLASQVESASANVAEAEAALAKLRAGATAAEVAAAEARVAAAEAQVTLAAGQMLECEAAIEQAEAQVQIASNEYAELAGHPTETEITAAEAEVAIAEAGVSHAQAAYNGVRGDPQIASRPEALALYQATATLEAARAKADLVKLGPTRQQLAVAQSRIAAAEAAAEMARSKAPGSEAAVQAALADQSGAQAALDALVAGATQEEIAMAEARVLSARAALSTTQAQLRQSQIVAPFAGQVGAIHLRVGEMAVPGGTLLLLGNPTAMQVETADLRETDVVRLQPGMAVEVTFDALPERIFQGRITEIAPVSNTEKGSTNYTVHITVDDLDETLRWGMTAFVNIQAPRDARIMQGQ